jgi:hypothetical protein
MLFALHRSLSVLYRKHLYAKTLASSTYIAYVRFHEGRRQFIYRGCTRKYVEKKKNYLKECMLNIGGVTHTLQLVTESNIKIFFDNLD